MGKSKQIGIGIVGIVFLFYLGCFHYTDQYEFGMTYNMFSGQVMPDAHTGYHITVPWVLATKLDMRPHRVCIPTTSHTINCKLVRFVPEHYQELIAREGFHYYWWYNRVSFNWGQDTYRGVENLLLGYAYANPHASFIEEVQQIGN